MLLRQVSIAAFSAAPWLAAEKAAMDTCRKSISDCRLLASGQGGCMALANRRQSLMLLRQVSIAAFSAAPWLAARRYFR
ncbi:hypothetical protein MAHJHV51_57350 [Mycobacterium avium subsp. hominissuis]